jgi:hypothetical protein
MTKYDIRSVEDFAQNMYDLVVALINDHDKAFMMAQRAVYLQVGQQLPMTVATRGNKPFQVVILVQ